MSWLLTSVRCAPGPSLFSSVVPGSLHGPREDCQVPERSRTVLCAELSVGNSVRIRVIMAVLILVFNIFLSLIVVAIYKQNGYITPCPL